MYPQEHPAEKSQSTMQKDFFRGIKEAQLYKKLANKKVHCLVCRRFCVISDGLTGACRVRKNIKGKLYSLVYGRTLTMAIDPIEKKPLFHFMPGTSCMSISTHGCNFHCTFCQNWESSQEFTEHAITQVPYFSPEQIVEQTLEAHVPGISYTYTEPTIFFEYALDTMKLARKAGLYNVWVSNGYMSKQVADAIIPYLDAINIDLKGNADFYKKLCVGIDIKGVKENIKYFAKKKVHVEVTNLIVPGFNDKDSDFKEVAKFIKGINPRMPLHFSKFFPNYKLNYLPPTPEAKILRAKEIAEKSGLKYVYAGNLAKEESTFCEKCKNILIKRVGFEASIMGIDSEGRCKRCGTKANIIL